MKGESSTSSHLTSVSDPADLGPVEWLSCLKVSDLFACNSSFLLQCKLCVQGRACPGIAAFPAPATVHGTEQVPMNSCCVLNELVAPKGCKYCPRKKGGPLLLLW